MAQYFFRICCLLIIFCGSISADNQKDNSKKENIVDTLKNRKNQGEEIRLSCRQAQDLEKQLKETKEKIDRNIHAEKLNTPVLRNTCNMLTRCFTMLFDMQRFSDLLAITRQDRENNFVQASIIIKNFMSYFRTVSSNLKRHTDEIAHLKNEHKKLCQLYEQLQKNYAHTVSFIRSISAKRLSGRKENRIQSDVVELIAKKSESIEELSAELEAENIVGVFKNTQISTKFSLEYPVFGKIIHEFGDKDENGHMIYYVGFEVKVGGIITTPVEGLVVFSGKFLNYGNMVIISNGDYKIFLYSIDEPAVITGDIVKVGDYIGRVGEDALLKMELRKSGEPLDPRYWMQKTQDERNLDRGIGIRS